MDYMPPGWMLIVDESHITVPQLRAMYAGDRARKATLVEHGFRLPSALDNRPLNADEFWSRVPQALFVSATPGAECEGLPSPTELICRPTGVLEPALQVIDTSCGLEDHLLAALEERRRGGERSLVTCLTKRSAMQLADFLSERGVAAVCITSDSKAAERLAALDGLRFGKYDVLVGCNLLREGLDLPQVSLVAILDAEKQGFLRSETSLIQTIGRAARHVRGTVLLYSAGGVVSAAMAAAMAETDRRRARQLAHNAAKGITPRGAGGGGGLDGGGGGGGAPGRRRRDPLIGLLQGAAAPRAVGGGVGVGVGEEASELYGELREWRRAVANAKGRRPFMVITEATMQQIACKAPATSDELLAVKGIGAKKLEMYGEELLRLVARHSSIHGSGRRGQLQTRFDVVFPEDDPELQP